MPERFLRTSTLPAAAILGALYLCVFVPGAYFRFDDFWQINSSVTHGVSFAHVVTTVNEADERWNPAMRGMLWVMGRAFGIERAWPFYLVAVAVHALNVVLIFRIARAAALDASGRWAAAFVATGAINLSAYSITGIYLLHGVASMTFALAAVLAAANYVHARRAGALVLCAAATYLGLLFKEYAIAAPLIAAPLILWMTRDQRFSPALWAPIVAAFAAGGAAFALSQLALGLPLVPDSGRYSAGGATFALRTLVLVALHTGIWLAVPVFGALRTLPARTALTTMGYAVALVIGPMLPTLALSWLSPGHVYLALPGTALAAGVLVSSTNAAPGTLRALWLACAVAAIAIVIGISASREILRWGPLTQQALADWKSLRQPADGRVIWFDAHNRSPYGGLAKLVGPGIRLRHALEMVSGERIAAAAICIDMVVGPPYEPQPGDALFVHRDGRLHRVSAPPYPGATCLP